MNKKDLIFAAIALSVLGVFIALSLFAPEPPAMTARPEHAGLNHSTPRETCWQCHAPDSQIAPMSARHPKKGKPPDQTTPCYACHKYSELAERLIQPTENKEVQFVWLNRQQK